jgi:AcrR family transcriptional regulator
MCHIWLTLSTRFVTPDRRRLFRHGAGGAGDRRRVRMAPMSEQRSRAKTAIDLNAEVIVGVALGLLRSGGPKLSMRKLGSELNVSATALYRYFPNRDSLYEAISDEVVKEIVSADEGGPWPQRLRALIAAQERLLTVTPGIAQFMFDHQESVPAMRWMDAIIRVLLDAGFAPRRAVRALTMFIFYVNPAFFVAEDPLRRGEIVRGTSPVLRSVEQRRRFPALAEVVDELAALRYEDQYLLGADRIIAALAVELERGEG